MRRVGEEAGSLFAQYCARHTVAPVEARQETERCTIILTPRDLFSVTETCLQHLFANTPEPFDLIVILGGAPPTIQKRVEALYGHRARLIFIPGFLTTPELRSIGLREARTRLAVCLDTNVFVRPGWLTPLIECQRETSAAMVVPLVLEEGDRIHTAGNDLFITSENGQAYGSMELRFHGHQLCETNNLTRRDVDFGEVHCQLFVVETALRVGVYDEVLREGTDIDSGLTIARAGCTMLVEPRSVVFLHYPAQITDVVDVALHRWKWDIPAVMGSYQRIREKWNIDVGGPRGDFKGYLVGMNSRLGPFTQLHPSPASVFLDRLLRRFRGLLRLSGARWRFSAWRTGYYGRR